VYKSWQLITTVISIVFIGIILAVQQFPTKPRVLCADVFTTKAILEPTFANPPAPYTLTVSLSEQRPDVFAVYQIIDTNGFGWLTQRVTAESSNPQIMSLPNTYPVRRIRLALLHPEEMVRAQKIQQASRQFDLPNWVRAEGWLAPQLTLCESLEVQ
jgi:hypothetical protein